MANTALLEQIAIGNAVGKKTYVFNETHDRTRPTRWWFQQSKDGLVLFVVFYTQACRWSRCLGCNLPSTCSQFHVSYRDIISQIDYLFADEEVMRRRADIRKIIVSNNGSVLDEETFSSTALIYLVAKLNLHLLNLSVLSIETRADYVDIPELEFLSRAIREGDTPTSLELAIGFEAFDDEIRNRVYKKGLTKKTFENLVATLAPYGFGLKCYFMQKPVPEMTDGKVPPLALLPMIFIFSGLGEPTKIILVVIGIMPAVTLDIYFSVKRLPAELLVKALTLGASRMEVPFHIVLPMIMPSILTTIRLNLLPAWLFVIAGEAIAANAGLGYRVFLVRRYLAMDTIIPYVLWIAMLAFLADFILSWIIQRRYPWYGK